MALEIILVEDSADDALLLQRAFKILAGSRTLKVFEGGVDALTYLIHSPETKTKGPDLLVLDLQLPDLTGISLLAKLKELAPHLKDVPIAVVSNHMGLRAQLAEGTVNRCFEKPSRYEGWRELASALNQLALIQQNNR